MVVLLILLEVVVSNYRNSFVVDKSIVVAETVSSMLSSTRTTTETATKNRLRAQTYGFEQGQKDHYCFCCDYVCGNNSTGDTTDGISCRDNPICPAISKTVMALQEAVLAHLDSSPMHETSPALMTSACAGPVSAYAASSHLPRLTA
jgi:hypothetical protein